MRGKQTSQSEEWDKEQEACARLSQGSDVSRDMGDLARAQHSVCVPDVYVWRCLQVQPSSQQGESCCGGVGEAANGGGRCTREHPVSLEGWLEGWEGRGEGTFSANVGDPFAGCSWEP